MKKSQVKWAISLFIIGIMITSTIILPAEEADTTATKLNKNLEIKQMPSKFSPMPKNLELSKQTKAQLLPEKNMHQLGIDIPVMDFGGIDVLNPSLATDGGAGILLAGEVYENAFNADIHFRTSTDGGNTWLPEEGTIYFDLASAGYIPEKPVVDYAADLGGIGSYQPIGDLSLPQFDLDSITDWNAGDEWLLLTWNTDDMVDIDSVDAAGWSSAYSPAPEYSKGVIGYTGDDGATTNILYLIYSTTETGGSGAWTGNNDDDYEWEFMKLDNDLSTGMHWEAYEITSNYGEHEPAVEIDWCQLDGSIDWWQTDWSATLIEGAKKPDIDAANGKAYCVFEFNGGISCAYSNDNGENVQTTEISSTGSNPHVSIAGSNIICTYISNGNLIAAISETNGATWEDITINDDSGTVADDTHSSTVASSYIAWANEGHGYSSIYFDTAGLDVAIIEIDSVSGGIGVNAVIKNTGTADANDIPYSLTVTGGILGGINKEASGTISVAAGGTQTISLPMIIGFGSITITVQAGSASETLQGTQLLIFTNL